MTQWLLMFWVCGSSAGAGCAITTVEYTSKEVCEVAAQAIRAELGKWEAGRVVCIGRR
jgi:predicted ArsR family transcriptional regulator